MGTFAAHLRDQIDRTNAENERMLKLIAHMDSCIKRGGPSNYFYFLPEDEQAIVISALSRAEAGRT